MLVTGGHVYLEGSFVDDAVLQVADGIIARIARAEEAADLVAGSDEAVLDASGCFVVPGFIDLHFHGCAGVDFCDGTLDAVNTIARWEAAQGVTAICPATMTYPESVLNAVMDASHAFAPSDDQAALVGINMEGPFISPNKLGAQNPAYVQPADADMVRRLDERSGGLVKLVDVAPEEPGALDFIRAMAPQVRISIAHTCADYDCAHEAFSAGARQLTHLFNAMPGLHHRNPGPIAAAVEHPDVFAELIADGVHVHPAMVRLAFSLFGAERIVLISDTMEAAGLDDGQYELGGQDVFVRGNRAELADGTLAGSVTNVAACLRIAVREMGIPLESAVRAATENPARALGVFDERGSIAPGKTADLVVLDTDLNVVQVVLRGQAL